MPQSLASTTRARSVVVGGNIAGGEAKGGHVLTGEELKKLAPDVLAPGEETEDDEKLRRGDIAYIPLDDEGEPSGPAKLIPTPDKPEAAVQIVGPAIYDEVVTPAGAPITSQMNPTPKGFDITFEERNPRDGPPVHPGSEQQQWDRIMGASENRPKVAQKNADKTSVKAPESKSASASP